MDDIPSTAFQIVPNAAGIDAVKNDDIIPGLFQRGKTTLIYGDTNTGKSLLRKLLSESIISSNNTIKGYPITHGDTVSFSKDDIKDVMEYHLTYSCCQEEDGTAWGYYTNKSIHLNMKNFPTVKSYISGMTNRPALITFDDLFTYCAGDTKDEIAKYIECCKELASYYNCSVCNIVRIRKGKVNGHIDITDIKALHDNCIKVERNGNRTILHHLQSKENQQTSPVEMVFTYKKMKVEAEDTEIFRIGILTED